MNAPCPAPLVAIVVKWPRAVARIDVIERVARRLSEARLGATWSVEHPSQAAILASWNALRHGGDVALSVADAVLTLEGVASPRWTEEIGGRLQEIRAVGATVETLHAGLDMSRSSCQRTLRLMGVRAIVTEAASAVPSAVRPLPFGIWQLAPRVTAPARRGWTNWLGRRRHLAIACEQVQAAVAMLDLSRVASGGERAWRELDAVVAEVVDVRARGVAAVVCVGELAGRLADQNVPRPQRSILRAA